MSNLKKVSFSVFMGAFEEMKEFHKQGNDPLPEVSNRSAISQALEYPFGTVFGKVMFWGFYRKAAAYFYTFSKGHILANGNKRSGVLAVNLFYAINGRSCGMSDDQMYDLAKYVAQSDPSKKDQTILHIAKTFKKHDLPLRTPLYS